MSLSVAQAHAYDLANTLMQTVLLIQGDDGYGVMEASDFDGEASQVLQEFNPFEPAL